MLELKEAAERRAQKNAIRLKELELQEKRHAAKVRKMEMDAEIQKAHLTMLNNMANMFTSGSMAAVGGICGCGSSWIRVINTTRWIYDDWELGSYPATGKYIERQQ